MLRNNGTMLEPRDIFYLKEEEKNRPYICMAVFTNDANIIYNYLVIPITSKNTIGMKNLVRIKNINLKSPSYAKLSNIRSIGVDSPYERANKISTKYYRKIIENFYDRFFKEFKYN